MREIRKSGSMRGSGRKALLRKCHLSLSTLPGLKKHILKSQSYVIPLSRSPLILLRHLRQTSVANFMLRQYRVKYLIQSMTGFYFLSSDPSSDTRLREA